MLQPETTEKKEIKKIPFSPPSSDFPSDVLKWMKENAKRLMPLKLMKICKYFQHHEFPYLVVQELIQHNNCWKYKTINQNVHTLKTFSRELWITESLIFFCNDGNLILDLIPKIVVCDIKRLRFQSQFNITFEQFKILTAAGTVKFLEMRDIIIKNEKGVTIPLENILECLPNITNVTIYIKSNSFVSHQKATNITPQSLRYINLQNIEETFNIEECFKFIKSNPQICFCFCSTFDYSLKYTEKLQSLTDNLTEYFIQTWSPSNQLLFIDFKGLTAESRRVLQKLNSRYIISRSNDRNAFCRQQKF